MVRINTVKLKSTARIDRTLEDLNAWFSSKFAIADEHIIVILYAKFRFKGESLWMRVSRLDGDVVVGRVRIQPVSHGLWFGQLIGIPIADVIDNICIDKDL